MKINFKDLKHSSLFQHIPIDEIPTLIQQLQAFPKTYKKDTIILHVGDHTTSIGILLSGTVYIEQEDFWGSRNLLAKLERWDLFSEVFAFTNTPSNVNVICGSDCEVLFVNIKHIFSIKAESLIYSVLYQNLIQILAGKNLYLNAKMTHLTKRTTRDKILSYLSFQAQLCNRNTFSIPFDRQQFADYLSVDRSALSNELSKLQKEGYILFHKNQFELLEHMKKVGF